MDNKEILDALAKIPELVKAAETFKRTTEKAIATLAEAVKQRPEAIIPESELDKMSERISKTPCAPPELEPLGRKLASNVSAILTPIFTEKAKKALDGAAVEVRHTHAYCFEKDLKEVADKRMAKLCLILIIVVFTLIVSIVSSLFLYFNGETYIAKQFQEVYSSQYLTPEEKDQLKHSSISTGILPTYYHKDPEKARQQLKRNRRILKQRQKQKSKNGTYSTDAIIQ